MGCLDSLISTVCKRFNLELNTIPYSIVYEFVCEALCQYLKLDSRSSVDEIVCKLLRGESLNDILIVTLLAIDDVLLSYGIPE